MNGLLITLEGIDGSGKTTVSKMLQDRLAKSVPERNFVFTAEPTNGGAGQILRARLSAGTQEASTQEASTQEASTQETSTQETSTQETSTQETSTQETSTQETSTQETSTQETSTQETSTQETSTQETSARESNKLLRARKVEELFLFMADHSNHLASMIIPSLNDGNIVISDRYTDSTAAYQGVTLRGIVPDPVMWIINLCEPWDIKPNMTLLFAIEPGLALERIRSREYMEKFERLEFLMEVDNNFRQIAALEQNRFIIIDANQDIEDVAGDAFSAILNIVCRS